MSERQRIDDLGDLVQTAIDALVTALRDGNTNHPAGSWREETTGNQFNHLGAHFKAIQTGPGGLDQEEDHLSHLICRAVMAKAIRDASKS